MLQQQIFVCNKRMPKTLMEAAQAEEKSMAIGLNQWTHLYQEKSSAGQMTKELG